MTDSHIQGWDVKNYKGESEIFEIEFDDSTGLPLLPNREYWKVQPGDYSGNELRWMKKGPKWWPFNFVVSESRFDRLTEENIRRTAVNILWRREEKARERIRLYGNTELYGKYPPNKLNIEGN